jgi:hypothetical protein
MKSFIMKTKNAFMKIGSFVLLLAAMVLVNCTKDEITMEEMNNGNVVIPDEISMNVKDREVVEVNFTAVVVKKEICNFKRWKSNFAIYEKDRKEAGLTVLAILQNMSNPNDVTVYLRADDEEAAYNYAKSGTLKESMQTRCNASDPYVIFLDVLRFNENVLNEFGSYLLINHRVTDFNEWVATFDSYSESRWNEYGLYDVELSQSKITPEHVFVSFGVTDLEKAKEWLTSPYMDKFMYGVEGELDITFWTVAN